MRLPTTTYLMRCLLGCVSIFLSGCCAFGPCCDDVQRYEYHLSADDYGFVPYDSNSTFPMRQANSGAVTHFTVTEATHKMESSGGCCEGCCTEEWGEALSYTFHGDDPAIQFYIGLRKGGCDGVEMPASLAIQFGSFLGDGFGLETGGDPCVNRPDICLDSLVVQGVPYTHVYQLATTSIDSSAGIINRVWYNPSHGLLKFSNFNGDEWELVP